MYVENQLLLPSSIYALRNNPACLNNGYCEGGNCRSRDTTVGIDYSNTTVATMHFIPSAVQNIFKKYESINTLSKPKLVVPEAAA